MSTKMNDADWALALDMFQACLPRVGAKAKDDRLFLRRCTISPSTTSRGVRRLRNTATGTVSGRGSIGLASLASLKIIFPCSRA